MVTLGPSPAGGGTTGKIYFNGALQNGGTRDNIPVSIGDIGEGGTTANFIGNGSWNDPRPTEQQDDFRLYGYELDATDVLALYNGTTNVCPGRCRGLVLHGAGRAAERPGTGSPGATTPTPRATPSLPVTSRSRPTASCRWPRTGRSPTCPTTGYAGTDTFTYKANDGTSTSAATTVTITVAEGAAEHRARGRGRCLQHRLRRGA